MEIAWIVGSVWSLNGGFRRMIQKASQLKKYVIPWPIQSRRDRKSTRLNSSHVSISYAVFCYLHHLCLHSLPTRRSSDLKVADPMVVGRQARSPVYPA